MMPLTLAEIASALSITPPAAETAAQVVRQVSTDSRQIGAGDLFVALRGERYDGHEFIAEVAAKGAVAAIVEAAVDCALPQLVVPDSRLALGIVARLNRRRFNGPVIAITGSAGKTTCKEMLAAILAGYGNTLATTGNLNNEIGVPLTLLRLAEHHQYGVIEMGAGRAGDIRYLCRFVEPDIGIVTSALPAHLEGFGDLDTIAQTKGELFSCLSSDGVAVINGDDPYRELWCSQAAGHRIITFGLEAGNDIRASAMSSAGGQQFFTLNTPAGSVQVTLALLGRHNLRNALAAAGAAFAAGISLDKIASGLGRLDAVAGRLQSRPGRDGGVVIDDSYNANPGAVQAAIDVLAGFGGRRRLILGHMAELGASSEQLHCEMAEYARNAGIDELWCVGPHAPAMVRVFGSGAWAFHSNEGLLEALPRAVPAGVTLVKGSRSARMETVVAALCDDAPPPQAAGDY